MYPGVPRSVNEFRRIAKIYELDQGIFMKSFLTLALCFLSMAAYGYPADKTPCGLSGTIDERISDCQKLKGSSKGVWVLVSRTSETNSYNEHYEIYEDTITRLIWGDKLKEANSYYSFLFGEAAEACGRKRLENGNLDNFRVPSLTDYQNAESHQIRLVLPNMEHRFWTSTGVSRYDAYYYNGSTGETKVIPLVRESARCIKDHKYE